MINAYKKFWLQYADFSNRSTRSDYWWVVLCHFLISLPFVILMFMSIVMQVLNFSVQEDYYGSTYAPTPEEVLNVVFSPLTVILIIILLIYNLATLVPNLAITVRRLRDAGFHWAFVFLLAPQSLSVVPVMWLFSIPCSIALLVLMCMPTKKANPYAFGQPGYYQSQPQQPGQFNQGPQAPYQQPGQPGQAPQAGQFGQPQQPGQFNQGPQAPYQQPGQPGQAPQQPYPGFEQANQGFQASQAPQPVHPQPAQQPLAPQQAAQSVQEPAPSEPVAPAQEPVASPQESPIAFETVDSDQAASSSQESEDSAVSEN